MIWLWLGLGLLLSLVLVPAAILVYFYFDILHRYMYFLVRAFHEKPLFIVPHVEPVQDAEAVRFPNGDGQTLCGCYLQSRNGPRQGVILFGLEFGSDRWSCLPYCQVLLDNGFDVFSFETRGQGESDPQPGYEPMQWVTGHEVRDFQAAMEYLKGRADAPAGGFGFFGISRGAGAGMIALAREPMVRCFVTDGVFATHSTMVPYMQKWIAIVSKRRWLQRVLPAWYYGLIAHAGLRHIRRQSGCRFPHLERRLPRRLTRPLFMIHGGADTYIKPEMARRLFNFARKPKDLWIVEGAKHNQALQVAPEEYRRRVLEFFQQNLAPALEPISTDTEARPSANGAAKVPANQAEFR